MKSIPSISAAPALGAMTDATTVRKLAVAAAGCAVAAGAVWLASFGEARYAVAGAVMLPLGVLAVLRPQAAIVATLAWLPFQAELRRLMMAIEPWSGYDPLLLVAPFAAALLFAQLLMRGFHGPRTPVSRLAWALLAVMLLQVLNPLQGGLRVGLAGCLFYVVPLLWYWIGREYLTPAVLHRAFTGIVVPVSLVTSAMGIYQVLYGFLPYQQRWIDVAGYTALQQSDTAIKAFSTYGSSQEFAAYMVAGIGVLLAMVIRRRNASILLIALVLVFGMLMTGSRGPIVVCMGMVAVALAVQGKTMRAWAPGLIVFLVLGGVGLYLTLSNIDPMAVDASWRPMLRHQVEGLTDPMDSTAPGHVVMIGSGILAGVTNPFGYGLGATTIAAGKFGADGGFGTEVDISNLFVSLGAVGGLIYLALIAAIVYRIGWFWHVRRTELGLIAIVVLAGAFGQWLSGGMYSVVPLVWLTVGVIDRDAARLTALIPSEEIDA